MTPKSNQWVHSNRERELFFHLNPIEMCVTMSSRSPLCLELTDTLKWGVHFVMQKQWFQYASLAQRESDDTGSTGRFSYVMCPSAEQFSSVQWSFFLYKQQWEIVPAAFLLWVEFLSSPKGDYKTMRKSASGCFKTVFGATGNSLSSYFGNLSWKSLPTGKCSLGSSLGLFLGFIYAM